MAGAQNLTAILPVAKINLLVKMTTNAGKRGSCSDCFVKKYKTGKSEQKG